MDSSYVGQGDREMKFFILSVQVVFGSSGTLQCMKHPLHVTGVTCSLSITSFCISYDLFDVGIFVH